MKKIKYLLILFLIVFLVACVEPETPKFQCQFIVDDEIVYELEFEEESEITFPETPTKEGYTFTEWTKEEDVNGNLTFNASFTINEYTVKFYNGEELIKEVKVEYNEKATAPKATAPKGYKFSGWDKEFENVKEDLDVYAQFELQNYTIVYKDEKGKVIEGLTPTSYNIDGSASIDLPNAPEKDGFEFLGWYENNTRVVTFFASDAEDKVFVAKYKEIEVEKELVLPTDGTFMFENIKKIAHSSGNGTYVYQPDFTGITGYSTSATAWTWSSLDTSVANISQWSSISIVSTGYAIIKAVYISDPTVIGYAVIKTTPDGVFISSIEEANTKVICKVTFMDKEGNIIETKEVEKGKTVVYPTPPTVSGYCFVGWSAENINIEADTTIEANYVEGNYSFEGKKVSILGDSISTYKGYIPDGYAAFYPYPTADFGDVNQTWWMRVINGLGMKLLKNNSYSGSCVAEGTGSSGATNMERLKELIEGNEKPDVIIIYMGANDCASSSVSLTNFKNSYKKMLDSVKTLAPEAEIYLSTLPSTKLYSEDDKIKYNQVIKDYATELSLNLIDLSNTFTQDNYKNYVVDSCHPNKAGMIKMSQDMIAQILASKGITIN